MIYRAKGTPCNPKKIQGLEALDPSLGLIFPSQGLTLARQCIILKPHALQSHMVLNGLECMLHLTVNTEQL